MDQVSLPMRIALGAVLAFAALWFVALRPKPITDVPVDPAPVEQAAPAPAEAKPKPAAKAKKAAAAPAAAKPEAKAAADKPKAEPKAEPKPEPKAERKPQPERGADAVLADLDAGRAVVLLFWDGRTTDDVEVRRAVLDVPRRGGKVAVHVAKLGALGRYTEITQNLPVTASPTTLVIGPDRKASAIRGLTVTSAVDAAVDRALRAAKP